MYSGFLSMKWIELIGSGFLDLRKTIPWSFALRVSCFSESVPDAYHSKICLMSGATSGSCSMIRLPSERATLR